MKIKKFKISNFKGASKTEIALPEGEMGGVSTLIGLNESGKTTILEAISYFVTEDKNTASLVGSVQQKSSPQDLIPKDKKAAFSGNISVDATVALEDSDIEALSNMLRDNYGLVLNRTSLPKFISVERAIEFEDSRLKTNHNLWSIVFYCKTPRQSNFKEYNADKSNAQNRNIWLSCIQLLKDRMPKIVYFPTFLFNFPDKIYLEKLNDDITLCYRQVIQDILDSQNESLTVEKHIIERISRLRSEHKNPATFLSFLFSKDEKKQIDAVMQKISNKMSEVIFGSWNQILGRDITGKRVQIDWFLDGEKNNAAYVEIYIVDGQSKYSISERSLGFRWFFSFLLFTQFRKNRRGDSSTIFLFDEPAANLHSKAQNKLVESFSRIAQNGTYIIYSTHSHYMINPLWLENSYIVENRATDYDNENDIDSFSIRATNIVATKYRTFVGNKPTKTTYFQPVLDSLEVSLSPLMRSSEALIVEGKNDYYPLKYFSAISGLSNIPEIYPINGAGEAGPLISLFRGWGVKFVILLDDDKAGRSAKKKYNDEYLLSNNEVFTIGDIDPALSGKEFEHLYDTDVISKVKEHYGVSKLSKRHYALFFQEQISNQTNMAFPLTQSRVFPILIWIDAKFR